MDDHADDDPARVPSGLPALDRALGGGFPPGHLVALTASPTAQSEPFLHAMAADRPHRYLSTLRSGEAVRADAAAAHGPGALDPRAVDADALLRAPEDHLSGLAPESLVVVDPVSELEQAGRDEYRAFLGALDRALAGTDSVGVLHCLAVEPATLRRDLTLSLADAVVDFHIVRDAEGASTALTVPKFRRGRPVFDPVEFRFDDPGVPRGASAADGAD